MTGRRIDRRALFASGAAAALLAATGVSGQATPRRGGRLRVAVPRDGSLARLARLAVFETLTEVAPDGLLRPSLAVDWQGSADARDWAVTLRPNAVFHDGRSCRAADVIETLRASDAVAGLIVRAEAEGSSRLRLRLAEGNPQLPWLLADPDLAVTPGGLRPGKMAEWVGTGLYAVTRGEADRHFLGRRLGTHPRDGQAGWAESVEAVAIPDPAVRAEALRDGHVDVAMLPAPEGLCGRGAFRYHPDEGDIILAAHAGVGVPPVVSDRAALDDGRLAERWWLA